MAIILIAGGLLIIYLTLTGKMKKVTDYLTQGITPKSGATTTSTSGGSSSGGNASA